MFYLFIYFSIYSFCDLLFCFGAVYLYTLISLSVDQCHVGLGRAGPPLDVDLTDV